MSNLNYSYTQDQVRVIAENMTTLTPLERKLLVLVDELCEAYEPSDGNLLFVYTLLGVK